MGWFPIGPDMVFAPKNAAFKRLSVRNEWGRQGLTSFIAIDPTDPATIYVAERPSSGGTSAFRTRDGGRSWSPIADALQQVDPNVDPSCVAVNPAHPETIYLGTWSNLGVYVSNARGAPGSWGARNAVPGGVRKLLVDPRTAGTLATTVIYAATTTGVYRSPDGGTTWGAALAAGDAWTLEGHFPATGTARLYAGVRGQGVFYADDTTAAGPWRNLNAPPPPGPATGLPAPGTFDAILVGFCPRNPARAYAWLFNSDATSRTDLWTTSDPEKKWTSITMTSPPSPWYGYYALSFAVAPNSPGDGLTDILFFGSGPLARSTDSGRNWVSEAEWFHADQHAIAFAPAEPPAGTIPTVYIGCDGGLAKSSRAADPAYVFNSVPPHHNEGALLADTGSWQNLDHGKASSAVYQYASAPGAPGVHYIGLQDTGVNAGGTALGWRSLADADGGAIAAATGPDGVRVWGTLGAYGSWPGFRMVRWVDTGALDTGGAFVTTTGGGSLVAAPSNYETGPNGTCVAGSTIRDTTTTLSTAVAASPAAQAATPASMSNVIVGSRLVIDEGTPTGEVLVVTATTATTFTAVFTQNHAAGAPVIVERGPVVRVAGDATATIVSQDFMPRGGGVTIVAVRANDRNTAFAGTADNRVFTTTVLGTATAATVWTEVATDRPANAWLSDIAVAPDGVAYALMYTPITAGGVTTPLFRLSGGTWQPQACTGVPAGAWFGKIVADPLDPQWLYASHNARVYRLTNAAGTWTWTDVSEGLPGQWIYDLTAVETHAPSGPVVLLRAAIPTRACFEADARQTGADPAIALYVRDNPQDLGWGTTSVQGVPDPYRPAETFWHYMCADIKIDAHESIPGALIYQTDPEGNPIPPLDHVRFDELMDNSSNLPQNDVARVHVQVRNRSRTASGDVSVWAVYCNAAAVVPALSASVSSGNAFPFWSQFQASGTIVPALPADSPWKSVGPPQVLTAIDASNPRVASWLWTVPTLPSGDPGHFCMAVFIHSAAAPVGETTRMSVDEIAHTNRQVGQKNLHIGPPLPAGPAPGGEPGREPGGPGGGGTPRDTMWEYVEFHNPTDEPRVTDLVFDLRRLPPALSVSLRLTPLRTEAPLDQSLEGVALSRPAGPGDAGPARPRRRTGSFLAVLLDLLRTWWCLLLNLLRRLVGRPGRPCGRPTVTIPAFAPVVHEAVVGERVAVRGVRLEPFERAAAMLAVSPAGPLPPGETWTFDVQQWLDGGEVLAGGGRYVVSTEGERRRPKDEGDDLTPPTHDVNVDRETVERIERESEPLRYVPPFAREIVEAREKEQERR